MKKLLLSLLLVAATTTVFAQLKVSNVGNVSVGTTNTYSFADMYVGNGSITNDYESNIGVVGTASVASYKSNIGIEGYLNPSTSLYSDKNYGVLGIVNATTNSHGRNFGVCGMINGTNGAGVFGAKSMYTYNYPLTISGQYAGYFYGPVHVNGSFTYSSSLMQTSDLRLKENIVPLSSREGSALGKVLDMNVIEYNYKKMIPSMKLPDTVSVDDAMRAAGINPEKKHIGLIAQDLQKLYPELVEEGQDGYLAVNYIELVPVLIRAIQELKQELDEIKGIGNSDVQQSRGTATPIHASNATSGNVLYQNTPNPFREKTTIRFHLADDAQNAAICIFDLSGKLVKKLLVSTGDESVTVPGYEIGEGMFLYTLMVNGQEIDTKRMIITK